MNNETGMALGITLSTRISAGVDDHPCFLTFYTYDPY